MPDSMVGRQLPIPTPALSADGATEVLRAWIVEGDLSVSLVSAFDKPSLWGLLLADIARHAARSFVADGLCTHEAAMREIVDMLIAELDNPADLGSTEPIRKQ